MNYEENELIYLAGFFDGEGNIDITKTKPCKSNPYGKYSLQIKVGQKDKTILEFFNQTFPGGKITTGKKPCVTIPTRRAYLPASQWVLSANKAAKLLERLLPYLKIKQQEARTAIEFQKLKGVVGTGRRLPGYLLVAQEKAYKDFRELRDSQAAIV